MDKIYSRTRIKFPKIRRKKINRIYMFIIIIFLFIMIYIVSFAVTAYPIFVASCKTAAGSKATHIVNDEVSKVMSDYTYNDLMEIEKDGNGDIVLMKSNTVLINQITSKIISNIQTAIDHTPRILVYINYGTVSRNKYVKKLGS